MNTQNWSDDELDDLFRKSAERANPAKNPAAWQDLQARMNHPRPPLGAKLLRWGLPAILALITAGGVYWYSRQTETGTNGKVPTTGYPITTASQPILSPTDQPDSRNPVFPSAKQTQQAQGETASRPVGAQSSDLPNNPTPALTNQPHRHPSFTTTPPREVPPVFDKAVVSETSAPKPAVTQSTVAIRNRPDSVGDELTSMRQQTAAFAFSQPSGTANRQAEPTAKMDRWSGLTLEIRPIRGTKWVESAAPEPIEPPVAPITPVRLSARRSAADILSRLSVQAVLSPDLSSVGLHNLNQLGSNVGAMVQYQVLPRLSLQTGALWSTKRYDASVASYTWPPGALKYLPVLPESVTAKCMMVDVPLNLRYDIFRQPGGSAWGPTRWFVSTGVTSYYFNREVYDYQFAHPDDPAIGSRQYDNKALGRKGGRFGFSNVNVSVGYERPLSRHLSWQLEPFMKIPIRPIGYFNVPLLSTGAFLSLRYHL